MKAVLTALLLLTTAMLTPGMAAQEELFEAHTRVSAQGETYWITSSSGKTHNKHCRYYQNSKGYASSKGTGNNCKLCGGAAR